MGLRIWQERAWLLCAVIKLKVFPAPKYNYFWLKMAPSTYFFELNSKMASKNTLGHSLMTQNAPSRLYPVYQIWQVSKVECAKQGVFLEGKIGKTEKKISKIFTVPNRPKYHTDQLYTYKGYIDPVGFTEKRQKLSKWLFFCHFWPVLG